MDSEQLGRASARLETSAGILRAPAFLVSGTGDGEQRRTLVYILLALSLRNRQNPCERLTGTGDDEHG